MHLTSGYDCDNIQYAVKDNPDDVAKVMKYALQPQGPKTSVHELVRDFDLGNLVHGLADAGKQKGVEPVDEPQDPRIIACGDSSGYGLCDDVRRVFSSEGLSIGINALDSADMMNETRNNVEYLETFGIGKNIIM